MTRDEIVIELKKISDKYDGYKKIISKKRDADEAYDLIDEPIAPNKEEVNKKYEKWQKICLIVTWIVFLIIVIIIGNLASNDKKNENTYYTVGAVFLVITVAITVFVTIKHQKTIKQREEERDRKYDLEYSKYEVEWDQYESDINSEIDKIEKYNDEIDREAEEYLKRETKTTIDFPWKYVSYINRIIDIVESCRADSIKEAINVLHDDFHKSEMLENQRQIAEETERHNREMEEQQSRLLEETQRHNEEVERKQERLVKDIKRHNAEMEKLNKK